MTLSVKVAAASRAPSRGRPLRSRVPREWAAVALATALIATTYVWGRWLQAHGHHLFVNLPPLVGHLDPRFAIAGVVAFPVAVGAIVLGPRLAARLAWRRLLMVCFLVAVAWAASLALTEGVGGLIRSPASPRDYLHDAPSIGSPFSFLRSYVEEIDLYAVHVRAHPPGMTLIAWLLSRAGGGPAWLAALEIMVGASAAPAVLLTMRDISGEDRARAAAPFLTVAPLAVTIASSGDAFFAGVSAWAVTLVVLSTGRHDRRGDLLAFGGGVLFGATAFLSYGLVLLAAVPIAIARMRRRARPLALAALGSLAVALAFLAAGFWWVAGLLATRVEYLESVARLRLYVFFLVGNLAVLAVIVGPASIAGIASPPDRATRTLVGGALVAVALADLSGMSKAETERIWLPFAVWLLAATSALPARSRRGWLAANVVLGLLLEGVVGRPW
jgi:methylthioxylose transferase